MEKKKPEEEMQMPEYVPHGPTQIQYRRAGNPLDQAMRRIEVLEQQVRSMQIAIDRMSRSPIDFTPRPIAKAE